MTDDAIEIMDQPAPRGRRIILLLALLWLVAAAVLATLAIRAGFRIAPDDLVGMATLAAGLAAPLAALVLVALVGARNDDDAALLAVRSRNASAAAAAIRRNLHDIDSMLGAVAVRLEGVRATVSEDGIGLTDGAGRLAVAADALLVASKTADGASATLHAHLPDAQAHVERIAALLETTAVESTRQLGEIETQLAGIWTRNDEAQRQVDSIAARMAEVFESLETLSTRASTTVGERVGLLETSVAQVYDRTTSALDATRDGVHAQTNALLAAVDQARVALDHIGGEAARTIAKRLDKLLGAAEQLGAMLGDQDVRSRALVDTIERSFVMLDGKLAHSSSMGSTTLDQLGERVARFRDDVDAMGPPISATESAILAVENVLTRLREAGDEAVVTLATRLPATSDSIDSLATDVTALHAKVEALADPVARGKVVIADAATAFAAQQVALDAATQQFSAQLVHAKAQLEDIETQTQGSALASATALIEVLARVREVAEASTGSMRATIQGIVAEAEAALESAGTAKVESAFGAPVRAKLAEIETASTAAAAAAQAAIERLSQRLLGLTTTVATVEARIDEADVKYDARATADLSVRAGAIIDQLNAASIDITKRLAVDVGDDAWAAYLKGDRSVFARRAVQLLDRGSVRAIARNYAHDPEFRDLATNYIATFEAMLQRVVSDREGKSLAVTLVSSDVGKLYVALTQAVDRAR
jgi:hypothetical protein